MSGWLLQSALMGLWLGASGSSGCQQGSLAPASSGVLLHGLALAWQDKARSCSDSAVVLPWP